MNTSFLAPEQIISLEQDSYQVLEPLGAGGCGSIWKVKRVSDHNVLALKTINAFHNHSRELSWRSASEIKNFAHYAEKEIEFLLSLGDKAESHFIVPLLDKGTIQHEKLPNLILPAFVMPLYQGGDLVQYCQGFPDAKAFDFSQFIQWAIQISDALSYVHQQHTNEQPSVHRDLKPANVLLDEQKNTALIDFGIARAAADTGTSTVGGSRFFSAPEQLLAVYKKANGHNQYLITPAADMYSLGIVLHELLAGSTQAQAWLSEERNRQGHESLLPMTDYGQFTPVGQLGKVGGLTGQEKSYLGRVVKEMLQASAATKSPLKALPNINKLAQHYIQYHESLLAPWVYDRPSAKQALKHFQQVQAAYQPRVETLTLSPSFQQVTKGEKITLTLQFQGTGLSDPRDWLNIEYNGQWLSQFEVVSADQLAWLYPNHEMHTLKLRFASLASESAKQLIRLKVICGEQVSEAQVHCEITLSPQQLWEQGDTLAALKRELRHEWLEETLKKASTFEQGLVVQQLFKDLEPTWRSHSELKKIQRDLLALPLGSKAEKPISHLDDRAIKPQPVATDTIVANKQEKVTTASPHQSDSGKQAPKFQKGWLGIAGLVIAVGAGAYTLGAMSQDETRTQFIEPKLEHKPVVVAPEVDRSLDIPLPEMVTIPAGTFTMGCVAGRDDVGDLSCESNEKPSRKVKVAAFQLAKTEVTNKQYVAFLNEKGRSKDSAKPWFETKAEDSRSQIIMKGKAFHVEKGFENYPVVNVSWYGASAYVDWLKQKTGKAYRLPSEAEWEYAARAGSETAYSWGNKIGKNKANCNGCGSQWDRKPTSPVVSFPANAYGLYDMHGNVWEWVQDKWHNYQGVPSTASPWQTGISSYRVLRGGSWFFYPQYLRSAYRFNGTPDIRDGDIGFRPALGQ